MTNEEMFNKNINIAYKMTQKYKNSGIEYDDLKQICLFALWKAVITYKSEKGNKFSTYAYRVIQNELNYYLRRNKKHLANRHFSEIISENIILGDTILDIHNEIQELENNLNNEFLINKIRSSALNKNERIIFELYLKGYKQDKIAKIIGYSQPQVSRYIKNIRRYICNN